MKEILVTAYQGARRRITELAEGLREDQLRLPVPATPGWTVHELLAHLAGGSADAVSGRLDAVASDQWTARHVGERRHLPVGELLAEWNRNGPTAEAGMSDESALGPNLAADALCHEADLREALGLSRVDREHWQPFLDLMMRFLGRQFRDQTALLISDDTGRQWSCGSGEPAIRLHADGYELLRATYGRRSRRQIAGWNWTPEPAAHIIEGFSYFGPRDDDQPVPVAG
ncbi:MAG TPA: maleylpyruvate isomerase family mycothiol-dependent enzyme [Mycobacterium sp.]|nr:maleylpyruvate isomerase family mycothiol-dependent enzyme [Mycobacterium sp.]